MLTGVRTEEARALKWDHVVAWTGGARRPVTEAGFDHGRFAIYVWRSVRGGGDTKTQTSRRTLEIPGEAAAALHTHHKRQAADRLRAGELWNDHGLEFCTRTGTALAAGNIRRTFRQITTAAGIGDGWTPREMRHTFVSIMSDNGVPIEAIADLVGHKTTIVTQKVYRHQLKPVITTGATTMNTIGPPGQQARARPKPARAMHARLTRDHHSLPDRCTRQSARPGGRRRPVTDRNDLMNSPHLGINLGIRPTGKCKSLTGRFI